MEGVEKPVTIAIAGKGGTGKTTIAALLIQLLSHKGVVLAVDADPSTNLNMALGLPLDENVGRLREEMGEKISRGEFSPGISKQDYLDSKIREALVESKGLDLLAMGRPEGQGCYCAANNMLRLSIDRLGKNYDYIVIDCEAGMEHISRRTTRDIDILLIISDPTIRSIVTAARVRDLSRNLKTGIKNIYFVVNRVHGDLHAEIEKAANDLGIEFITIIHDDPDMEDLEAKGTPIIELPSGSPLQSGVAEIVNKTGI